MAFQNSITDRLEELRFPSLRSPDSETSFANGTTAGRGDNSYFSTISSSNDARGGLQRRFTTDSSKMSLSKPFGAQYPNMNSQPVSQDSLPQNNLFSSLNGTLNEVDLKQVKIGLEV
jgi:hypothetical protein